MDVKKFTGVAVESKDGFQTAVFRIMQQLLENGDVDALLLPVKVPAGDSYSWILCKDTSLIIGAAPAAPVMPVQGAKALKSLTRKHDGPLKVAAVMRPCEVRAAIELAKLSQVSLEHITLISYDCPGALPYPGYLQNPEEGEKVFGALLAKKEYTSDKTKSTCQICTGFDLPASDLHFSPFGAGDTSVMLIANSARGEEQLQKLSLTEEISPDARLKKIDEIRKIRAEKREAVFTEVQPLIDGYNNLQDIFANCIGCHNCQSACPICYCRQCYFDSDVAETAKKITRSSASRAGSISFPQDQVMFHVGRMTHMSLSCVSCGQCTDVCPVSIPVAKVFSYVGARTQKTFEYTPGSSEDEALPLREFKLSEIANIDELVKSAEAEEPKHE